MKRLLVLAIPALLLAPSLAPAQMNNFARGSSERNAGTLLRSDGEGRLRQEPSSNTGAGGQALYRGHTKEYVLSDMLASDDYFAAAGGTVPTYIHQLYMDVIGREPLPAEINYWAGRLEHDTRRDVTNQMLRHHPQYSNVLFRPPPPYDPGYLPDPASPTFRDPGGPYFHSPYFFNYEKARPIRAFELRARG